MNMENKATEYTPAKVDQVKDTLQARRLCSVISFALFICMVIGTSILLMNESGEMPSSFGQEEAAVCTSLTMEKNSWVVGLQCGSLQPGLPKRSCNCSLAHSLADAEFMDCVVHFDYRLSYINVSEVDFQLTPKRNNNSECIFATPLCDKKAKNGSICDCDWEEKKCTRPIPYTTSQSCEDQRIIEEVNTPDSYLDFLYGYCEYLRDGCKNYPNSGCVEP